MKIKKFDLDFNPVPKNGQQEELILDPSWITNEKGLHTDAVTFAEYLGRYLLDPIREPDRFDKTKMVQRVGKNAVTTTQLRNFFGEVRSVEMGIRDGSFDPTSGAFVMLRPRLAYARVRATKDNDKNRMKEFEEAMINLMEKVHKPEHFQNFVDFLEATVAYHKANGGKN